MGWLGILWLWINLQLGRALGWLGRAPDLIWIGLTRIGFRFGFAMGGLRLGVGFDRDRFGSPSVLIGIASARLRLRSGPTWDRVGSASVPIDLVSIRLRLRSG